MRKLFAVDGYNWKYVSVGGVIRVVIASGEDIAHLGELDQKKWTVLSCPVADLNMDKVTLQFLDSDHDGKINVDEVVEAAQWLTTVIKDNDAILKGDDVLPLDQINADDPEGAHLLKSAKNMIRIMGTGKSGHLSVEEANCGMEAFCKNPFNGDGVITPASTEDEALRKVIADIVATTGGAPDRSGESGADAACLEKFFAEAADYVAWQETGKADKATFPYADATADAHAAMLAVKDKIDDYFMRCRLIRFDESTKASLDVSAEKIAEIRNHNLAVCADTIALCPIARPGKDMEIPYDAVNPAWTAAFCKFRALVLDKNFPKAASLTPQMWQEVKAGFSTYEAWLGAKKGVLVESVGYDALKAILTSDARKGLEEIIEKDKEFENAASYINSLVKLTHYYRDFATLLSNYVIFSDFYARKDDRRALFEAGELYIDQRCCSLCIKVSNMAQHADMAGLSGMFLIYCACTSSKGEKMDIVAVMTAGGTSLLRPGKNAVFYDRNGEAWSAVVTKIVDNPINIRQAFWSPYIKTWEFFKDKLGKKASADEAESVTKLQSQVDGKDAQEKQPFDIAKFAGIFAAIGMAIGYITSALVGIVKGVAVLKLWQLAVLVVVIMLVISGPSCFIAWSKLRRRNLGPVLNANGWAINSVILVNSIFGATLTSEAKYPIMKMPDPYMKRIPWWRKVLRYLAIAIVLAFAVLYASDNLDKIGINYHRGEASRQLNESLKQGVQEAQSAAAQDTSTAAQDALEQQEAQSATAQDAREQQEIQSATAQ